MPFVVELPITRDGSFHRFFGGLPLIIVIFHSFPIKNGDFPSFFVGLPEGINHARVLGQHPFLAEHPEQRSCRQMSVLASAMSMKQMILNNKKESSIYFELISIRTQVIINR